MLCLDPSIFEKETFIQYVLQNCSRAQAELIVRTLQEDMCRLRTAKKTLMSENYGRFISVNEHLQQVRCKCYVRI